MAPGISTTAAAVRLAAGLLALAGLLFGSAGTLRWPEAWLYLLMQCSVSAALAVWLKRHNPGLLKDRMKFLKKSGKPWDKVIIVLGSVVTVPFLALIGLDAVRFQWAHVPLPVKALGFAGLLAASALLMWVMKENTYLSRVVEIQADRGHKVITTGPYQYVRHPMYVSIIMYYFCLPLALGSAIALILSAVLTAILVVRTFLEDKTLHRELEGYSAYAEKVRYRLIPGIW